MRLTPYDDDEYEVVSHSRPCSICNGDLRKCNGGCNGSSGYSMRRRSDEEIGRLKAKRLADTEARILAEADAIRARRSRP